MICTYVYVHGFMCGYSMYVSVTSDYVCTYIPTHVHVFIQVDTTL